MRGTSAAERSSDAPWFGALPFRGRPRAEVLGYDSVCLGGGLETGNGLQAATLSETFRVKVAAERSSDALWCGAPPFSWMAPCRRWTCRRGICVLEFEGNDSTDSSQSIRFDINKTVKVRNSDHAGGREVAAMMEARAASRRSFGTQNVGLLFIFGIGLGSLLLFGFVASLDIRISNRAQHNVFGHTGCVI
jgi:hypothetical protein